MIKQVERAQDGNKQRKPRPRTADQVTFRLPFISNGVDKEIRRALDRHRIEARLVHPKPRTLLQLAQPKVEPPKCSQRNARLITSTAWRHMWSMRLRVNYARRLKLDPLCVLCTREQRNTSPRQRTRPKPQPWGALKDPPQQIQAKNALRTMKPAINRRGEETGIDFLAWTLPPEDKQVMLFCTAKQSETKKPAPTLINLKPPAAIKQKFLTNSFHPTDDGVDLRNV